MPDGLHGFIASYLRYLTHVYAYFMIAADPFPAFNGAPGYPIDVEIAAPVQQSRLAIFFRLLLAIPAFIVLWVLGYVAQVVAFLAWIYSLFAGKLHVRPPRRPRLLPPLQRADDRVRRPADAALPELLRRVGSRRRVTGIRVVDYHTGGEPFRIVTGGVEPLQGETILDRRRDALERLDHVRRLLVNEPRGHADMYGCHVVPPNDDGADLGVVFFHNAGYSTACGHGTIALVTWALDEGIVERREGENRVVVDVPSGRLETVATVVGRPGALRHLPQRAVLRLGHRPACRRR